MTGNTKVWRAPLAGLASVAMIATMGVAASTANAVTPQYPDVKVTLDANGGKIDGKDSITVTDAHTTNVDGVDYADGVFDLYNTYGTDARLKWGANGTANRYFSGWYTSPDAGGQAVDPNEPLQDGTTLYAHWSTDAVYSDESEEAVYLNTNGAVQYDTKQYGATANTNGSDGASQVIQPASKGWSIRLQECDQVAAWQAPSADVQDGQYFDGKQWSADIASLQGGQSATPVTEEGTVVTFDTAPYVLFKDGVQTSETKFDVKRGDTLTSSEFQAVTLGADHNLATVWSVTYGTGSKSEDFVFGETALKSDSNAATLKVLNGEKSTQYALHQNGKSSEVARSYFVKRGSSFKDTFSKDAPDAPTRHNTTFLGWYKLDDSGTPAAAGYLNTLFFDANMVSNENDDTTPWGDADADDYDFSQKTTESGPAVVDIFAGYKADAKFATIELDPNYPGSQIQTVKIYEGKTVGEQLPTVTRDGYTLKEWKSNQGYVLPLDWKVNFSASDASSKIHNTRYVAQWTADSKYGKYGLLYNLKRGYSYVKKSHGKIVKTQDVDKDFDGTWDATAPTGFEAKYQLLKPEGFTDASWKQFNTTRDTVVKELIKELGLKKSATIDVVYNAVASRLSAEKADEFNAAFAGKLAPETDYPDVNYDDYGTHSDDIQYLTTKGIVKGYQDGTFGYGAPLARVDYIVWLYRAAGSPAVDSQAPFSDVNATTVPNKDFRDAIAWAAANKITTGYADGTFAPYATLNRQDAAAFLYRASGSPKFQENGVNAKFSDVTAGDTANHSKEVLWAASEGIAKGYYGTVTYFGGYNTLVRQDAAAFLARTLRAGYIAK
ncbi:S-layer homology domain-containing protein [Bifidobacterium myosotis]|nr:S-layer homology domain-containing protein [Bifidobacterium myosotis]